MSPAAFARARVLLRQAAMAASVGPQHRAWAAYTWAQLACLSGDLDEAIEAFGVAIALIPEMAGQRLARRAREQHLAALSELARDAAASAIEHGDPLRAVEFLEHGRGSWYPTYCMTSKTKQPSGHTAPTSPTAWRKPKPRSPPYRPARSRARAIRLP